MGKRAEQAVENKANRMNCAQAVAVAFADKTGLDAETLMTANAAYGVGIGATQEGTCGALVGAAMVLGFACKEEGRKATMIKAGSMMRDFKEKNGTVKCSELKGVETGVVLRACPDCVKDAAEMLEALLGEE